MRPHPISQSARAAFLNPATLQSILGHARSTSDAKAVKVAKGVKGCVKGSDAATEHDESSDDDDKPVVQKRTKSAKKKQGSKRDGDRLQMKRNNMREF